MEELSQNKEVKYCQIQQKLQLLAQAKLQNLGQTTIRRIQERLITLEKGISEEIASNQKISREYKLLLHKYQQQWRDIQLKNNQASHERTEKISELKDLMAEYFAREDKDGQQIFKQAPRHFEEKAERVAQELCQQISQRRQQIGQLEIRVQDVLQTFRGGVHRELSELDEKNDEKIEQLRGNCQSLRCSIYKKTEERGQTEAVLMQQIRNTVCEIKQSITNQKSQRQKNKDKLTGLVANAKQMIAKQ